MLPIVVLLISVLLPAMAVKFQGVALNAAVIRDHIEGRHVFTHTFTFTDGVDYTREQVLAHCAKVALQRGAGAFELYMRRVPDVSLPARTRAETWCQTNFQDIYYHTNTVTLVAHPSLYAATAYAYNCTNPSTGCNDPSHFTILPQNHKAFSVVGPLILPKTGFIKKYITGQSREFAWCQRKWMKHNLNAATPEDRVTYFEWDLLADKVCTGRKSIGPVLQEIVHQVAFMIPKMQKHLSKNKVEWSLGNAVNMTCQSAGIKGGWDAPGHCSTFAYSVDIGAKIPANAADSPFMAPEKFNVTVPESDSEIEYVRVAQTKAFTLDADYAEGAKTIDFRADDVGEALKTCSNYAVNENARSFHVVYRKSGWFCTWVPRALQDAAVLAKVDETALWSYLYTLA